MSLESVRGRRGGKPEERAPLSILTLRVNGMPFVDADEG